MEDEKYQVNIPANVKTRTELINGIGIKELVITAIAGGISLVLDILIYLITNNYLACLIIFGIITGFTFLAVMKDKNNICIADMLINIYNFFKGQKFYEFIVREKE